jgi:hypothetical protein
LTFSAADLMELQVLASFGWLSDDFAMCFGLEIPKWCLLHLCGRRRIECRIKKLKLCYKYYCPRTTGVYIVGKGAKQATKEIRWLHWEQTTLHEPDKIFCNFCHFVEIKSNLQY